MKQIASSLEDVGDILINSFGKFQNKLAERLYDNLMETTPEATGTLRANWKVNVGPRAGKGFIENKGISLGEPKKPKFDYSNRWTAITLYNNSPYIVLVNNGEGGNDRNQNFIQRAMEMTHA